MLERPSIRIAVASAALALLLTTAPAGAQTSGGASSGGTSSGTSPGGTSPGAATATPGGTTSGATTPGTTIPPGVGGSSPTTLAPSQPFGQQGQPAPGQASPLDRNAPSGLPGQTTNPGGSSTGAAVAPVRPVAPQANQIPNAGSNAPVGGGGGPRTKSENQQQRQSDLQNCLSAWDRGTHMSKADWNRVCRRVTSENRVWGR